MIPITDEVKNLRKRLNRITEEGTDSYWGVKEPLKLTKDNLIKIRSFLDYDWMLKTISVEELRIKEHMRDVSGMVKELEYAIKPKDRNVMEMVRDFFSSSNNPIAFHFKISNSIKDVNHSLDQLLGDIRSRLETGSSTRGGGGQLHDRRSTDPKHRSQYNASHHSQTMFPNPPQI